MADCVHCGTPFPAKDAAEKFCCKGCEFVHDMILGEGLDRFYSLRGDSPVKPVRGVPFESHDYSWLVERVNLLESGAAEGCPVEADFSLDGISCIGCVWLVEKIYHRHEGALDAAAHPVTGGLHLKWRAGAMDLPAFAREMASFGYTLAPPRKGGAISTAGGLGARLGLCGAFMMNAMAFTLPTYLGMPESFEFAGLFKLVGLLTATLSMLVGGSYFISRAWGAARAGELHIDLPIAVGLVAAFAGSLVGWAMEIRGLVYFDFVSTFVFLMLAGRYFQTVSLEKNRNRLQRARPLPETVVSPDRAGPLAMADLVEGLRFELCCGQSLPVSATVQDGDAEFSLEWINGEAEPEVFSAGRVVPSGGIYLGLAPVLLAAVEGWDQSLLGRLVSSERTAVRSPGLEKLLKIYLWLVLGVGGVAFAAWFQLGGLAKALEVMISIFVISCPCAIGLALPMADEIAGAIMERAGVFIRQPLLWSRLCKVRTIIFDKTGTLTLERPVLVNPAVIRDLSDDARLALARLTQGALHPVSRSLLECLGRDGQEMLRASDTVAVSDSPGFGRYFQDGDAGWSLGKPGWRSQEPTDSSVHDAELCRNGERVAKFAFRESLRADAIAALRILKTAGYRRVILSGDRPGKVALVAKLLALEAGDAYPALLPGEKEFIVRSLDHQDTLFLGDGANDSLAFDAAWTTGTPVVDRSLLEAKADFYFMGKSLRFLPGLLFLARDRRKVVRAAFAFAVAYNIGAVAVCVMGHMNPLLAAILMPASSVISLAVVTTGLSRAGKRFVGELEMDPDAGYGSGASADLLAPDHAN